MGYTEEFLQLLERRNAETCAHHLLPSLESGMTMLDVGCGPGSISVGLATIVSPGKLIGIDIEASQVEMATQAAADGGHANATFQVADVTDLPFDDDSFDAAATHAVLMHVPDTQAALSELIRVVRPGGVIGARETIWSSNILGATEAGFTAGLDAFEQLLLANSGHPDKSSELKVDFIAAGLDDVVASASLERFAAPDDVKWFASFAKAFINTPSYAEAMDATGIADATHRESWNTKLDEWTSDPAAHFAMAWGKAVGRVAA
jgi:ubiquinone/menaquinone biosynthesis C-methylase UbiE